MAAKRRLFRPLEASGFLLLVFAVSEATGAGTRVSGRVEMPELCSTLVSPAVVRLEAIGGQEPAYALPKRTHAIDQRGLMFEPRVVAMRCGETLRFGNADPELHNVHLRGKGTDFNRSVAPGESVEFVPSKAGVFPILCDVHTHMRGFIVVADSPWVMTCGRSGEFAFTDVPNGRYRLHVWHEMGAPLVGDVDVTGQHLDLGTLLAPGGVNPTTGDDRGKICERGCEPWPLVIDRIAMTLSETLGASGKGESASALAQDAYYRDYETSGMGMAIRVHLGRDRASRVEDLFRSIARVNAKPVTPAKAATRTLEITRETLLALGQASDELNRKGVTERSRIFFKTSPAFWIAETGGKPAVEAGLFANSSATGPVCGALAVLALLTLLLIAKKRVSRRSIGIGVGIVLSLGVLTTAAIVLTTRRSPAPALVSRTRPDVAGKSAFGAANPPRSEPQPVFGQAGALAPMVREFPIGFDVDRNHLNIGLLWHTAMKQASRPSPKPGDVHLLAKIEATEGNPNGFAKGDWVPYLNLAYTIVPVAGGPAMTGVLRPIVAPDGPRYGANLTLPGPGLYRVTMRISPPSDDTLGHFVDEADAVAPWWEPFEVQGDWILPGF